MRVHRISRLARLVATVAAGATLLGFGVPAAQAEVSLSDYKTAVTTAAMQVATGAHSQVAINNPQYNRGEVLEVDGKPFWYNGIQIRIDKLRDDPAYKPSDEQLQGLFDLAAKDGFTLANSQIRWLDIQPNHTSTATKTAVIANGDSADKAIGQGATMTVNRKNAQGGQSLGLVQINTDDMTAEEIDGAALRLYNTSQQSKGRTIKVYGLANNDWDASTVTWNTAPVKVDGDGNVVESDAVKLASQTINAINDDSVKAIHYYDFYLGAWIKEQAKKNPGQTTFSFVIQDSSKGGDDIAFGGASNDNAAYKPTLVYGDDAEFNYDVLDGAINMAANAGLKFEMLWFGLDTCSASRDNRVPVWALDETLHERTVIKDGKQLMAKEKTPDSVYGVYSYFMDKNDTELVSKEAAAIKSALNHVATIENADTLVGVQLSNEPRIGALHGSRKTDRSYSETSNKLFEQLGLSTGDKEDTKEFREYTMWTYNNTLGEAVKTSDHPVWTRVNLDEYADTEAVKYNEAKRANGGTNIDFIGIDHYRKTTSQLAQEGADDSQFANGSNLPMVMELGQVDDRGDGLYLEQDALATLSGGAYWTIYDACGPDGRDIYTFDKTTGTFSPYDDVIPGLFKTNNMLKKIGTDLATNVPGSRGGNQLVFFNAKSTNEGDFESAQAVGKDKAVTYKTSDNGVGIAVNKGANELALLTNRAGTFTINNLSADKVASAEAGYYDADNVWHKTGDVQVSGDSAAVVTLNAYDVVRIVSKEGGYGKVELPDEQILKIFEAENQQYVASDGVKTEEWDDGASNDGWVKVNSAKVGDSVTFTIDVPADGEYQLSTRMLRNNSRGKAQVSVDGKNLGDELDMYSKSKEFKTLAAASNVELTKGKHTVTYTVTGKNDASSGYVLGIDYIQLKQKGLYKVGLRALIEKATAIEKGNYTDDTWDALQTAIKNAQTAVETAVNANAITTATEELQAAIDGLLENTDKTTEELKAEVKVLIAEADVELAKTDTYSAENIAALNTARDNAQNLLNDPSLSPAEWAKEVKKLRTAIDTLKATAPTPATHTVTFNANGGKFTGNAETETSAVEVKDGETVSAPADKAAPVREGYKLVGWTTDEDGKTDYDFKTAVEASLTLYAKWEKVESEQKPGDKTKLNEELDAIDDLDLVEGNYTDDSWKAYSAALDKANAVAADTAATQADVDAAVEALDKGLRELAFTPDALETEAENHGITFQTGGEVPAGNVFRVTFDKLPEGCTADGSCKLTAFIYSDPKPLGDVTVQKTQDGKSYYVEVTVPANTKPDEQHSISVLDGKGALVALAKVTVTVDKSALKAAIAEAEKLDPDDYTYPSWHGVDQALGEAQTVLDDKDATQDEVNAALKTLKEAREELVKRPTSGGGTTVITKKQATITGVTAADAWFDGKAHVGFEGTPSSDFKGSYEVTYRGSGSTTYGPSKDAPTAAGTYRVTISVPESDPTWYGSLALEFSIRSGSTVVGRFYTSGQGAQGLHMWTTSDAESGALGASGWNREGDAFVMDAHAGDPVYRLYDPRGNQHLWTTSKDERDHLVGQQGWNDEGIAFYQNPAATVDVYRLYNPWTGEHLWTTSGLERDSLTALSNGAWTYEGVAFKAMAK